MRSQLKSLPPAVAIGLLAIAYVVSAQLGFSLAFATQQVTAVWPPAGIAVAGLLLLGSRSWPGVFAGAFVANALRHEPLATAAGIAVGNTLGPLLGAVLLRRSGRFDVRLERVGDVIALTLLGAVLAMIVTASNGVAQLLLAGIVDAADAPSVWRLWWVGDAMGVLLVAPLILTWCVEAPAAPGDGRRSELALLAVLLIAVTMISFSSRWPLAYPVFPVVIWAALRFGQRETAAAVVAISGIAVWATAHGHGPFVSGTLDQRLVLLVTFMAIVSVTALLLGAVTVERRLAQRALHAAHAQLEQRVIERTQELTAANMQLRDTNDVLSRRTAELASKNEEVEAFVYVVSHDLRAPLVNLQGFARELELGCAELKDLLWQAPMTPSLMERVELAFSENIDIALRYIAASADKFERLIGALLALSRTGQQVYRMENLPMSRLLQASVDSLHQHIAAAGARIDCSDLLPACGDVTAIGQVFDNLLGNALKYRVAGRDCRIQVGSEALGALTHYWIEDNGPGVPESAQRRLFQVFQRFHPELAAGDGIGLASVKRIVERHGGKVWADSRPGLGSRFHFTLPSANGPET